MKICVIGTGYVGLVTGVCLAELGNLVSCVDIDKAKVERLKAGESPIYEPGLTDLLKKNIEAGRMSFYDNAKEGMQDAEIVFIAVGTPSKDDGTVETGYVLAAAKDIARSLKKYTVIVNKSTVPIGTGEKVQGLISKYYKGKFDVVSNPEFLREGQAIADFMKPDRIVIGSTSKGANELMAELYSLIQTEFLYTNLRTAEMIKYASNAFLATSISFINSLSELCEKTGANIMEVAEGMKLDRRIGKSAFLTAGPGYGGSCFPKDVKGLVSIATKYSVSLPILESAEKVNMIQRERVLKKVKNLLGSFRGKKIAVWGLAFKPLTDDLRESPAVDLVKMLLDAGAGVICYDPVASENGKKLFPEVEFAKNALDALKNADCLLIMTEWEEIKKISLTQIKKNIGKMNIVDARNIYRRIHAEALGFKYEGIGQ